MAFVLLLALLCVSRDAQAFCRTRACDAAAQSCEFDAHGCLLTGPELHWASSCVSYDVQKSGSNLRKISYDDAHAAIARAFEQWLTADCAGATPSLEVQDFGPVDCARSEYNQRSPNANVFMFRDDSWPYVNAIDTLALTTVTYNVDDGEIYDADVEVNTFQTDMTVGPVGASDTDFNSIITHEVGHFLGLSHSDVSGATMQSEYQPGSTTPASIEQDDIAGVCAALAPARVELSHSCEPRHGFSSECSAPKSSGCQMGAAHEGGAHHQGFALVAIIVSAAALRRRHSLRSPFLRNQSATNMLQSSVPKTLCKLVQA